MFCAKVLNLFLLLLSIIKCMKYECSAVQLDSNSSVIPLVPNKPLVDTLVAGTSVQFELTHLPLDTKFTVFHVHTQFENVVVSLTSTRKYGSSTIGTNVGVVSVTGHHDTKWYVNSTAQSDIQILAIAQTYHGNAPIPGACNIEFPLQLDPNLLIKYDHYQSSVAFQYANYGSTTSGYKDHCESALTNNLTYDVYQHFLKEGNLKEDDYLKAIQELLPVDSIRQLSTKVATLEFNKRHTNLSFASFPQTGVFYAVIVKQIDSKNNVIYVPYVPAISYSCDFLNKTSPSCYSDRDAGLQVVATLIGAVGLFICFFGHRFFKTAIFYFGFLAFGLIAYILIARFSSLEEGILIGAVLILAALGGALWWLFWAMVGIPVLAVILPGLILGFLLTSVLFNLTPLGWLHILQTSLTYGMAFFCGTLLVPILLIIFTKQLSILACTIVGSYALFTAIDSFLHTNLGQIVFLSVKKGYVEGFLECITKMPFQGGDIALVVLWCILAIVGIIFQCWRERGRPAFPPHPYGQYKLRRQSPPEAQSPPGRWSGNEEDDERQPLLRGPTPQAHSTPQQPYFQNRPLLSAYPPSPSAPPVPNQPDAVPQVGYTSANGYTYPTEYGNIQQSAGPYEEN